MSLTRRNFIAAGAAAGASTVFGVPTIVMAAGPKEKLTCAVGSEHALVYLAWDVAKALGYFDAEGLDVNLIYTKGGTEAGLALMSGQVDYSGNAIDHAIAAAQQGKTLVMISDFMNQPGLTMLTRPENKAKFPNGAALKGKTIGITSVGSATDVIAHWLAHRNGFSKEDIKTVGVGGGATVMAALQSGQVDVALANDPYATLLIKQNRAVAVAEFTRAKVTREWLGFSQYTFTGALTRGDVIAKYPERTQKIVNALTRAMKTMETYSAQKLANALPDEYRGGASVDDWAASFSHSRPAYGPLGRIAIDGVRAVVETNEFFLGKKFTADPNKLFDNSFVEKAIKALKG
ncbi:MAG: ABC transporter substrate-binding protein [Candidatus Eremiobacteraeota bacterium]|nr:ABC transporter substrate-binding protein [Candidatus Eremiobacteraeota bacterium]